MTTPITVDIDQAALLTGVSARTIDRACKADDAEKLGVPLLPSKLIGRRRVINYQQLVRWADQLPDG